MKNTHAQRPPKQSFAAADSIGNSNNNNSNANPEQGQRNARQGNRALNRNCTLPHGWAILVARKLRNHSCVSANRLDKW